MSRRREFASDEPPPDPPDFFASNPGFPGGRIKKGPPATIPIPSSHFPRREPPSRRPRDLLPPSVARMTRNDVPAPVMALNDSLSRHGLSQPDYEILDKTPLGSRVTVQCKVRGRVVGKGEGLTEEDAIEDAAKNAYFSLFNLSEGTPGIQKFLSDSLPSPPPPRSSIDEARAGFPTIRRADLLLEGLESTSDDAINAAVAAKAHLEQKNSEVSWPKGAVSWWGGSAPKATKPLQLLEPGEVASDEPSTSSAALTPKLKGPKKRRFEPTEENDEEELLPGGSRKAKISRHSVKPALAMQPIDMEPGEVAPKFFDAKPEELDLEEKIPTEPCTRHSDHKMSLINELGQTKILVANKKRRKPSSTRKAYCVEMTHQKTQEVVFRVEADTYPEAADHCLDILVNKLTNLEQPPQKRVSKGYCAWLVRKKFVQICRSDPWMYISGKCLAGFILEQDGDFKAISLGTGSTFISREDLSDNGTELIDSHAEVIARRGLMRFMWTELDKALSPNVPDDCIFQMDPDGSGKLSLKPTCHFHLFISMPPCGYSQCYGKVNYYLKSVWSETEARHDLNADKEMALLAVKVGREGPGVYHGTLNLGPPRHDHKLQSLACSDKVLKWNVCGYQGGLLSEFIKPVYMESITFGRVTDITESSLGLEIRRILLLRFLTKPHVESSEQLT